MSREARVAGLRRYTAPSLEAVDRRRTQLWAVALVVVAGLAIGIALLPGADESNRDAGLLSMTHLRLGLVGITVAFCVYAAEKEVHLRRLTRLLVDERVLSAAFSNRLEELRHLSDAESAVNAHLHLDQVLDVVLASAVELLGGVSGEVYLRERDGSMRLGRATGLEGPGVGSSAGPDDGLVGAVMVTGEAALGDSDDDRGATAVAGSVMAAPIRSRAEVLGVLLLRRGPDGLFSEYDLRVLTRFAEHAAPALAHASLYEGEQQHVAELVERNRSTSSFVAMVSHEFKAPLAAIIGAARTLQRRDLPPEHVTTFLEMIEGQGERLSRLVEDVLDLRRSDDGVGGVHVRVIDAVSVARGVGRVSGAAGRPIHVRAPAELLVTADPGALEQVLLNLVDNAFVHGSGPVEVELAQEGNRARVSVLDEGPGVPAEEVPRVFDPFARGTSATARGSGLGLHLVKTLVEAQGGTVGVSRRPEGGANFTVCLPAFVGGELPAEMEVPTEMSEGVSGA